MKRSIHFAVTVVVVFAAIVGAGVTFWSGGPVSDRATKSGTSAGGASAAAVATTASLPGTDTRLSERRGPDPVPPSPAEVREIGGKDDRAPTFDIVRVGRLGEAVIAGRADPGAQVRVTDGERVIGSALADRRGEWVVVPDAALGPGTREIGLEATKDAGSAKRSASVVVVSVPDRGQLSPGSALAANPAMAVMLPREGMQPSRLLQSPAASVNGMPPDTPSTPQGGDGAVRIASIGPSHDPAAQSVVDEPAPTGTNLSVETVDYDEAGRVALSGRAKPGAQVRVYLDNSGIGEAVADAGGRWELTPKGDVAAGRYRLRADQMAEDGKVTKRVELPFARAEAFGDLPPGALVVVQPGNSLWRIARRTYGDGRRYTVIFDANQAQIDNPDLIFPGQVFSLPETGAAATATP